MEDGLKTLKLDVAVYDRTSALASSPTYGNWALEKGGSITSLHIINLPFDRSDLKVHECLKEAVKTMGEPYYYQPQAQLQDREIIIKENRGCVIVNRTEDEILNLCNEILKQEERSPCPAQCPAYVHSNPSHVCVCQVSRRIGPMNSIYNIVININGPIGGIAINKSTPLVLCHRIQLPLLERTGARYEILVAVTQNIDREMGMMDRCEMPSKSYAYLGSNCLHHRQLRPADPSLTQRAMANMEPSPLLDPGSASTSGSKRSTLDDDVSSLRDTVANLSKVMNLMLEREAKRQQIETEK